MKAIVLKSSSLITLFLLFGLLGSFSSLNESNFQNSKKENRRISGTVTDINSEPVSRAIITIDKGGKGTITDFEGKFEIIIPSKSITFKVSSIGYETKEVELNSKENYSIALKKRLILEEVVVTKRSRFSRKPFKSKKIGDIAEAPRTMEPSPAPAYSIEAEHFMDSATESSARPEKSELKKESKSRRAGQITAGEWNDLNNWEDWNNLVKGKDYREMSEYWKIYTKNRVSIFVTNQYELPVTDCLVSIKRGSDIVWSAKTDNSGKAELWIDGTTEGLLMHVQSGDNNFRSPTIKTINEGVNHIKFREECDAPTTAEIMFVVDATGSMGDEIEFLKSELSDVIERVEDNRNELNFKWGSVFYRDEADDYLTLQLPLTEETKKVMNFIQAQSAGGGGDYPEAVNEGLEEALMQEWSEDAIARIIFLVLDAPPHHNPAVLKDLESQIEFAASRGIKIIPITASGINRQTEYLMKFMSIMTNGTYIFITDDSGIGGSHLSPLVTDFDVEYLNDLLVRVIQNYTDPKTCIKQDNSDPIFQGIEIFPNPAADYVLLSIPEGVKSVSLTTNTGQVLYKKNITEAGEHRIDLTAYVDGMYIVYFKTEDKIYNSKVIKGNRA